MIVYHELSSEAETYCEKMSDFVSYQWIENPYKDDKDTIKQYKFTPVDDLSALFKNVEIDKLKYQDKYDQLANYVRNMVADGYQVPSGLKELVERNHVFNGCD